MRVRIARVGRKAAPFRGAHGYVVHPQVPGIYERKWELDSLMNPLDIAAKYHQSSGGDLVPFDATWLDAVDATMTVMVEQQQSSEQEAKGRACAIDPWAQRVLFELLCMHTSCNWTHLLCRMACPPLTPRVEKPRAHMNALSVALARTVGNWCDCAMQYVHESHSPPLLMARRRKS